MGVHRFTRLVIACAALLIIFSSPAQAEEKEFSFKTTVEEVRLTLVATDKDNRYIRNLSPTELAIIDNERVVREFRSFLAVPEVRLNVLIVLDATGSVSIGPQRDSANVLQSIAGAPWYPQDSISVLTFGSAAPQLACLKNCPDQSRATPVTNMRTGGQTPLFDVLVRGAKYLGVPNSGEERSVIVLFSDGEDNFSLASASQVVRAALDIDAQVYTVNLSGSSPEYSRGARNLLQIARATGGLLLPMDNDITLNLQTVLNDMRSAYVVTYVPPERTPGRHDVYVHPIRNLGLRLRTRQSYVYSTGEDMRASR